jgi:hypothetical protein
MLDQNSEQQSELISLVKTISSDKSQPALMDEAQAPPETLNHVQAPVQAIAMAPVASNHIASNQVAPKHDGTDPGLISSTVAPPISSTKVAPADYSTVAYSSTYATDEPVKHVVAHHHHANDDTMLDEEKPFSLWRFLIHGNRTSLVSLILLLVYFAGGICFFVLLEGWAVGDTIYFAVVVMTTVGYGDFAPTTDHAKLFTCLYVLCGLIIDACAVSNIADAFTAWAAAQMREHSEKCMFEHNKFKNKKRRKAFLYDMGYFAFMLLLGMTFLANVMDFPGQDIEGNVWINSLYLSVITLTTVGFGDIPISTDVEKAMVVLYMLVGIPVFANFLQAFTSFVFGGEKDKIKLHLIQGGASPENFNQLLKFRDALNQEIGCPYDAKEKKIDRFHFLACVLVQNGLLEKLHIKRIMHSFDRMDTVEDGFITLHDVERHFSRETADARGSGAENGPMPTG